MRKFWYGCALIQLMVAPLAHAVAEEIIPPSPIAKTALIIDAPAVKKGEAFWAGVTFTLPEHWHVYWQNSGDSGIATTLAWTLPAGLSAGEIEWPVPERFDVSGIINYGYSREVTLAVPITASADGVAGEITVKANWLVCHESCIPESAVLTAKIAPDAAAAKIIADARARVPTPLTDVSITYRVAGDAVSLQVPAAALAAVGTVTSAQFFPIDDGVIRNLAAQQFSVRDGTFTLTTARGSAAPVNALRGVLHLTGDAGTAAHALTATLDPASIATAAPVENIPANPIAPVVPPSLIAALTLAFLGGLILNIMPCVLPILALKALAISKKAEASRGDAARQGVAYTAGVIGSFLVIAGIMLALKASGEAIGWGFQLQNSGFVALLALVMLLVAANLLGLFELPVLFGRQATAVHEGTLGGSFFTGALAVLVATPCTAPFMATAVGATLSLPTAQALLVFASLGLGMASPFLLISLWPAAQRLIPKPGVWMVRFKQLLAIPMLATAAWLVWVLVQMSSPATVNDTGHEAYSVTRLEQLRRDGTPVLVDATAAWCLTCKVNERVALKPAAMQEFFRERGVVILVADWTNSDPVITEYLASFGRNGVPLYVYYPPHGKPVVLPQILTPSIVREAIAGAQAE